MAPGVTGSGLGAGPRAERFRAARFARQAPGGAFRRGAAAGVGRARRVAAEGRVLLLDEPFAGLDAELRAGLIATLKSWLGPVPVISVTHDVEEAFLLGAEVVRVAAGRVVAQGPVAEVLAGERERLRRVLG